MPPLKFRTVGFPQSGFKPRCLTIDPTLPACPAGIKCQIHIPPPGPQFDPLFVTVRPACFFFAVVLSSHPGPGVLRDHHGPRVLRSWRVMLFLRSSLLRPDPPVSSTPAAFPGPLVIPQVRARRPGLGCRRDLPCFVSVLLLCVPSPLRREEAQRTPVCPRCPWPSSTKHGVGSSSCPDTRFGRGFAHDAAVFASCYGPHSCWPSWTSPTWNSVPAAEDVYTQACPGLVTHTPSRV